MRGINHREDWSWSNVPRFGGGGGGSTNTIQKSDPWSGQQPALSDIYAQAMGQDRWAVPQYFPGNTYAPLTDAQNQLIWHAGLLGLNGGNTGLNTANQNLAGVLQPGYTSGTSGAFGQGQGVLSNELDPSYLNPWNSPSFNTVVGNTLASTIPAVTSGFNSAGRADSGLATRAATMAATDAVGNLAQNQYNTNQAIQNAAAGQASNNYLTQQGNQIKGAALAPGVDAQQMSDLIQGLGATSAEQTNQQNQIASDMARYNYGQMLPWNQLSLYQNAVQGGGSPGGTTTTTQPYYSNPMANVASGVSAAATAAALASAGAQAAGYSGLIFGASPLLAAL